MSKNTALSAIAVASLMAASPAALADFSGTLTSSPGGGLTSGVNWADTAGGFQISWDVGPNGNGTWNYAYQISALQGANLTPALSHLIIELSQNITSADIFNLQGVNADLEFGTFGPHPSNPSFPVGKSIFGVKLDMNGDDKVISFSFDSTRQPMWGDFYSKGGPTSYAYNKDLGVAVANVNDYASPAVDASGAPLAKILVPDTIPTPGAFAVLGVAAGLSMGRRRGR